jgi:hypothetical protein
MVTSSHEVKLAKAQITYPDEPATNNTIDSNVEFRKQVHRKEVAA